PAGLRDPLHARGAEVAYPRVVSTDPPELAFFGVAPGEPLSLGRFGILEPLATGPADPADLDLILVPPIPLSPHRHPLPLRRPPPAWLRPRVLGRAPARRAAGPAGRAVPRVPTGRPVAATARRRACRFRPNPARAPHHRRSPACTRGGALVTILGIVLCLAAL